MKKLNREEILFLAKLSLRLERYEDMRKVLRLLIQNNDKITGEEINLLCIAYKTAIGNKRASYRVYKGQLEQEKRHGNSFKQRLITPKMDEIKEDIITYCKEIIEILNGYLTNNSLDTKLGLIYSKMHADFYRYLAENTESRDQEQAKQSALEIYDKTYEKSKEKLSKVDPIRLGIALSFSTLYNEILNKPQKACGLARKAFQEALTELDSLFEHDYTDEEFNEIIIMIQSLRDQGQLFL